MLTYNDKGRENIDKFYIFAAFIPGMAVMPFLSMRILRRFVMPSCQIPHRPARPQRSRLITDLPVLHLSIFSKPPQYFRRISRNHAIPIRKTLCNNRTCTYDCMIAQCNTGQNHAVHANPASFTKHNIFTRLMLVQIIQVVI